MNFKERDVFDEVEDKGQFYITTRWIISERK